MCGIWLACALALFALPFQLIERPITWAGGAGMAAFVCAFALGTLLVPRRLRRSAVSQAPQVDSRWARWLLGAAALAAGACLLIDASGNDVFDLVVAYELRTEAASALLEGEASASSVWFQIGFLLYPACYVFIAAHVLYAPRVRLLAVALIGLLPILLATLVMGGRTPLLYALLVTVLAWRERRKIAHPSDRERMRRNGGSPARRVTLAAGTVLALTALFGYFAAVFIVRAEVVGGTSQMFLLAEDLWGVGFRGALYPLLTALLGDTGTYMVFVFVWYAVQGLVMGNHLLGQYDGPLLWGIYGVDIVAAVVRRAAPEHVTQGFDALLTLGTYGFLPSAWGSLYVDFGFAGLGLALLWGVFAGFAWTRIVRQQRQDWLLVGPFVSLGILFSLINTPFGFTNGFITHLWLLGAFLMLRRRQKAASSISVPTALQGTAAQ